MTIFSRDSSPNICVVIPTYNEEKTIGTLVFNVNKVAARLHPSIVIVDDGSSDGTFDEIKKAKQLMGVTFIERGKKMGLGSALSDGLYIALALNPDYIVTMDADLSHRPGDVPRLVEACSEGTITIGSRYIEGGSFPGLNVRRQIVSSFGNWAARIALSIPIKDCTSGFKCYHRKVVESILPKLQSKGYDIQIETLFRAIREGYKVVEIPIEFSPRTEGKSKLEIAESIRYIKTLSSLSTERHVGKFNREIQWTGVSIARNNVQ